MVGRRVDQLGFGFLEQYDVGIGVAPQNPKILAIRRPVEGEDMLRFEMCDLASGAAVGGLNPDVFHAILRHRVGN